MIGNLDKKSKYNCPLRPIVSEGMIEYIECHTKIDLFYKFLRFLG